MITIKSVYDLKTLRVFQKYSFKKIFILSYICGVLLFAIGIFFAFNSRSYHMYLFLGVALPVMMHVFYKIKEVEIINKNVYLKDKTIQTFTFDNEEIMLEQVSRDNTFKDYYSYKEILSIIKYKRYRNTSVYINI